MTRTRERLVIFALLQVSADTDDNFAKCLFFSFLDEKSFLDENIYKKGIRKYCGLFR